MKTRKEQVAGKQKNSFFEDKFNTFSVTIKCFVMIIGIDTDGCITDINDMGHTIFSKISYIFNAQPRVGCLTALRHLKSNNHTLINITGRRYDLEDTLRGRLT